MRQWDISYDMGLGAFKRIHASRIVMHFSNIYLVSYDSNYLRVEPKGFINQGSESVS